MEKDKKIIKTKQDLDWNLVFYLLQMFYDFTAIMQDKEFREQFDKIFNYVADKINTQYDGNIKDFYVIVEQEATNDEEYEEWLKNNKQ